MPFQFECPHCGHRTLVDDRYGGQTGPCAGCGKAVTIPTLGRGGSTASPAGSGGGGIAVLILGVLVACALCCAGAGFFWVRSVPMVAPPRAVAASSPCSNNLKALALAMHNYHDVYSSFPPAYVADGDGKPMHSWRVLLLPFLNRQDLYNQYRFDEPWDGPNNSQLISMIPSEYRCPDDVSGAFDQTSYAMIVGPGFFSDGPAVSAIADILDGTSNTIMLVEAHGSGIAWTEPRDLDGATISFLANTRQPGQLQGHAGHVKAVFCDGSVHDLPDTTPAEDFRAMATVGGGEFVPIP